MSYGMLSALSSTSAGASELLLSISRSLASVRRIQPFVRSTESKSVACNTLFCHELSSISDNNGVP